MLSRRQLKSALISSALVLACLPLLISSTSSVRADEKPYGSTNTNLSVDLRDLADFAPELLPDASLVMEAIKSEPEKFQLEASDTLRGVELTDAPSQSGETLHLNLVMFVERKKSGSFFRKLEVAIQGNPREVGDVRVIQDIPVEDTHFAVRVGLMQRKAIFEDREHGIRKIYPLGVGGIDEGLLPSSHGQVAIVTPAFQGAVFNRARAIQHRTDPAYYKGQSFNPITKQNGSPTAIAFHIIQHPKMVRGFDSHGCMRLRQKDLIEFHTILMRGAESRLPVDISVNLPEAEDHPYPLRDDGYVTVLNCAGPGEAPRSCRDPAEHNLLKMVNTHKRPPFEQLMSLNADTMTKGQLSELEGPVTDMPDGALDLPESPDETPLDKMDPNYLLNKLFGNQRPS